MKELQALHLHDNTDERFSVLLLWETETCLRSQTLIVLFLAINVTGFFNSLVFPESNEDYAIRSHLYAALNVAVNFESYDAAMRQTYVPQRSSNNALLPHIRT